MTEDKMNENVENLQKEDEKDFTPSEKSSQISQSKELGGQADDDVEITFGRPETYDFKEVKLPENMILDENMTGKFLKYASKLDLSQKSANDMVAMAVELTEQARKNTLSAIEQLNSAKIESYRMKLKSDEEIGGVKLNDALQNANIAYDSFFKDDELRSIFAESGLTVHPKFIKALKAIGQEMKEDTIHTGGYPNQQRSHEDILYPSMKDMN